MSAGVRSRAILAVVAATAMCLSVSGACTQPNPDFHEQDQPDSARPERPTPDAPSDRLVRDELMSADPMLDATAGDLTDDRARLPDTPGLLVTPGPDSLVIQSDDGTVPQVDECPPNQVLIGYQGEVGQGGPVTLVVTRVRGLCGELRALGEGPYSLVAIEGNTLPERGQGPPVAGMSWTSRCARGQVIVGVYGRAGAVVNGLGFRCAPLTFAVAGGAAHVGTTTMLPTYGGDGGTAFEGACPANQVARGQKSQSASWLNGYGLLCGTPTLVP
jgi:hypothetical protein